MAISKAAKKKASEKSIETKRLKKLCTIEQTIKAQGFHRIAGVDEAGRGPLAGPVVAAACILPDGFLLPRINDSKKLPFDLRYKLYQQLIQHPDVHYAVGVVEAFEIDRINILQSTFKAMMQAVNRLSILPDYLLVDGKMVPKSDLPILGVIDGDRLSQSIAAASIIAKVTRDHIMMGYHDLYSNYGFNDHMGYGTVEHLKAIELYGPSPIHRMSFGLLKKQSLEIPFEEELVSNG